MFNDTIKKSYAGDFMKIKYFNKGLTTAYSLAFVIGSSFLLFPENSEASIALNIENKLEKKLSDMDYANQYIRKNPETGDYFKELDAEYREKEKNAKSPSDIKRISNEYVEEKKSLVLMFANLERKNNRIKELKNKDYSQVPGSGEPRGMSEARRLAATCGRGETVGYSNYFGDPSFYQNNYPLVGSDLADIEAISVLREGFLPKINTRVTKFISDNQINLTLNSFVNNRSDKYSDYHSKGGQKSYVDSAVDKNRSRLARRDKQISDDMFRYLHNSLGSFSHKFLVSESIGRDGNVYETKSGSEILAECRFFWSKGNTVKDYEPDRNIGYNRNKNRRIGIEPNFYVAPPVQPMGTPIAKQNLNETQFNNSNETVDATDRIQKYNDSLGIEEDKNESADDLIQNTFGDDYKDPSSFKKIEGGGVSGERQEQISDQRQWSAFVKANEQEIVDRASKMDTYDSRGRTVQERLKKEFSGDFRRFKQQGNMLDQSRGSSNMQQESSIMKRFRNDFSEQQANKQAENGNADGFSNLKNSRQKAQKPNFNDLYN